MTPETIIARIILGVYAVGFIYFITVYKPPDSLIAALQIVATVMLVFLIFFLALAHAF